MLDLRFHDRLARSMAVVVREVKEMKHWARRGILLSLLLLSAAAQGQTHVAEPAVNLGDTSFLDGIAGPGGVIQEIGDGSPNAPIRNGLGNVVSAGGAIKSISSITHLAWITHKTLIGGYYGVEVVVIAARANAGTDGKSSGLGDSTISPLVLQWGKQKIGRLPIYQRIDLDFDLPTGAYTRSSAVNLSQHAFTVHPNYAVTAFPFKHIETSWRLHYLWNATNNAPPFSSGAHSTQAGQAIHFNGTVSYQLWNHLWIGPNGYYLRQITDGRINGVPISGSPEQVGSIGLGAVWKSGSWFFFANGYHEVGAKNRPSSDKIVLRIEKIF